MSFNKHLGKQGHNCRFRSHKIFNPFKSRSVNFCPSVFFSYSIASVLNRYLLTVLLFFFYLLLFFILPIFIHIHLFYSISLISLLFLTVLFNYLFFELLSVIFCSDIGMYSRYFDPHNKNHPASH